MSRLIGYIPPIHTEELPLEEREHEEVKIASKTAQKKRLKALNLMVALKKRLPPRKPHARSSPSKEGAHVC